MTREDDTPEVYRITGAMPSRSRDLDRRVNRYLISMAIRTACVVLVFVVPGPARWVFAAGAVFLPYVAVLFANASDRRRPAAPARVDHRGLAGGTATGGPEAVRPPSARRPSGPPPAPAADRPAARPHDEPPAGPAPTGRPDVLTGRIVSPPHDVH